MTNREIAEKMIKDGKDMLDKGKMIAWAKKKQKNK